MRSAFRLIRFSLQNVTAGNEMFTTGIRLVRSVVNVGASINSKYDDIVNHNVMMRKLMVATAQVARSNSERSVATTYL